MMSSNFYPPSSRASMRQRMLCAAALVLAATPSAQAQNASSWPTAAPTNLTSASTAVWSTNSTTSVQLNATATSTSAAAATSSKAATPLTSSSNPLIPTTISKKCQAFLAQLNGDDAIAACTVPLIATLDLFAPEAGATTYTATSSEITASLDKLCVVNACSDTVVRAALTAFNGNCSIELQAQQPIVLGEYDTLYILQPFRAAVCSKDAKQGYCLTDIADGYIPPQPAASNLTITNTSTTSANETLTPNMVANTTLAKSMTVVSLAKAYTIELVAPSELFVQFQVQARRFLRRRQFGAPTYSTGTAPTNSTTWVSAWSNATTTSKSVAPSPSATNASATNATVPVPVNATVPAPASVNSTSLSGAGTAFDLTGVLPNPTTWSAHSLPFLFLSTNMSSSMLCTSCTKSILAAYVSWEMRIPYAIGLSNSPMLGRQGDLWTGVGETCGGGFLSTIQSLAGQSGSLTGDASMSRMTSRAAVLTVAAFVVLALLL